MYCTKCGEELEEGAKFCGKCGTPVNAGPQPVQNGTPGQAQSGYTFNPSADSFSKKAGELQDKVRSAVNGLSLGKMPKVKLIMIIALIVSGFMSLISDYWIVYMILCAAVIFAYYVYKEDVYDDIGYLWPVGILLIRHLIIDLSNLSSGGRLNYSVWAWVLRGALAVTIVLQIVLINSKKEDRETLRYAICGTSGVAFLYFFFHLVKALRLHDKYGICYFLSSAVIMACFIYIYFKGSGIWRGSNPVETVPRQGPLVYNPGTGTTAGSSNLSSYVSGASPAVNVQVPGATGAAVGSFPCNSRGDTVTFYDDGFVTDNVFVPFSEIDAISETATMTSMTGIVFGSHFEGLYEFVLKSGEKKRIKVSGTNVYGIGTARKAKALFEPISGAVNQYLLPSMAQGIIEQIKGGATITLGNVTLSPYEATAYNGLQKHMITLSKADFGSCVKNGTNIVISDKFSNRWFSVHYSVPNALLLPYVMPVIYGN